MPYEIVNQGARYCVRRVGARGTLACHETRRQAVRQIAALMIAERREQTPMSAQFAGTRPSEKADGHKSPPKGYPPSRDAYADPTNYRYPLDTPDHARAALAYWGRERNQSEYTPAERAFITARIIAACRRFGIEVSASHSVGMAAFDLGGDVWENDGLIYRAGKVFEVGEYPDKGFALSEEEADAACGAGFAPVPLDLEHIPTPLSGKLGEMVALERDGADLIGVVGLPRWLDEILGDDERKVSTTWDRATKRLTGLALVRTPRVTDAALLSAFSAAFPPAGPTAVSDSSSNERPAPAQAARPRKEKRMGFIEKLKQLLAAEETGAEFNEAPGGEEKAPRIPPARSETNPDTTAVFAAEIKALKDQIAMQTRRSEEERMRRIDAEATAFADGLVRDGKAVPAENPVLIALFSQACRDDDAGPVEVTFGTDAQGQPLKGGRVVALRALFQARPQHVLMGEHIPEGAQVLLNSTQTEARFSQEEVDRELARTPMGRAALAARKNGGK